MIAAPNAEGNGRVYENREKSLHNVLKMIDLS